MTQVKRRVESLEAAAGVEDVGRKEVAPVVRQFIEDLTGRPCTQVYEDEGQGITPEVKEFLDTLKG